MESFILNSKVTSRFKLYVILTIALFYTQKLQLYEYHNLSLPGEYSPSTNTFYD
ncbi:primosomal protein N' [Wolbachia endosymbiont of Onchocerca ochengi]|nr:primosomal protein N' [Wolbachia endosymbiont of Onchocerca ochengi]